MENSAGHYRRADAALSRALTALDRTREDGVDDEEVARLRARILITRAVSRLGIDGPEAALTLLDGVRDLARERSAPILEVQAHLQAGAIHVMCSNWIEALDELAHVEPHLDELVPRERASALINRGLAAVSLQDLDGGRRDLERALEVAVEHDFPHQEFKARHNLGCVAYLAGDIPDALRLMAEAAEMPTDVGLARAHLDHAKVLLDAGLVDEAEVVLHRGLEAARRDRQRLERGDLQLDLARAALLRGDPGRARVRAGHAARTFRALRATTRADEVELFGAAVDLGAGRHLARAARVAARWETLTPVLPSERLATRIRMEVALARADLERARTELARLESPHPRPLGAVMHEHLLASRLASAEGDRERATSILRDAARRLAREQGDVHSLEVRAGLAFHAARIRDVDVMDATDSGTVEELFESVERWRAASHRVPPLRPPDDPETADLVRRLRRVGHRGTDAADQSTASDVSVLQGAITQRLRSVRGSHGTTDDAPTTAEETVCVVRERGVTLVTFHEVRGTVVRLVVTGTGIRQSVLGPVGEVATVASRATSDLRAAAVARPSMAAFLRQARDSSLRGVDETLLRGLDPDGTVVVVPTVALASLPWRALPSLREHPVVAAPSVTAWVRRGVGSARPPTVTALVGPGLPRGRAEVDAVARAWGRHTGAGAVTTTPTYAVSADVRSALASSSVVHLAAHGHHVDQSPLFSSLDVADGPVFAHELAAPVAAELVVLSACDVGRSRGRTGDEPLGLAAALLILGVQCVVAATNPVHDDVAAAAMVDLHQRLVDGTDVATALQQTARAVEGAESFCAYGSTWSRPIIEGLR
ncbi:CHAT domain-containing protein [Knoellia sp. CPCC 206435]|uniref:CHAT domain-containing protein n=1 Tax=Knoellia terrae TaxID=3404797 RepID=UPI003B430623